MIELLHTDCMNYMATLPDAAFDLAIVDPPYGRGEDGGTNRCHGVKQKNGTVLRCMDGGYAKKDWDREPPPPRTRPQVRWMPADDRPGLSRIARAVDHWYFAPTVAAQRGRAHGDGGSRRIGEEEWTYLTRRRARRN